MGTYHQLTEHQRYQIYALRKAGHDQQRIAETVSVSPSTICRELRRNRGQRGYRPSQAHHKALARRRHKAKATKMTSAVIERIEAGLRQQWSPEQISGRLEATDGLRLSPQRIYQHIQADRQAGGTLYRHLRRSQKKRKKRYGKADGRGQIKDRVSIDQRPAIVAEKSRIGDWEIDLVLGGQRSGALVSLVERRSRYTVLGKTPSKQAEQVAAVTIELLKPHTGHTHTITADNGKEFAHHATISQALDATVYFAHPYHAGQRGLNENTNGLIRQYVPKGMALDTLSDQQVHHIMDRLNHRPRKGLAFQTPHEILCKETGTQPKHGEIALTS
ncbi:MAG: IS30 family transposase [Gemmatimonadetes bacterium]|nr:IS30 family transposase [Gemmatimonadota bacterium]MYC70759.1 IS30 family transposase [Gemmatimonadota bacterium]